jgi:hypothetical protein
MGKLLLLGIFTIGIACAAATAANAQNPNVPSWSPYATMGYEGLMSQTMPRRLVERRSAYTSQERYTLHNPEGPLNDYYRHSGLSDRREDCASYGCSGSNGN